MSTETVRLIRDGEKGWLGGGRGYGGGGRGKIIIIQSILNTCGKTGLLNSAKVNVT